MVSPFLFLKPVFCFCHRQSINFPTKSFKLIRTARMLTKTNSYEDLITGFSWNIPPQYNIAEDICDKWADGTGKTALIYEREDLSTRAFSFDQIKSLSNKLANAMAAAGVQRGDRIGVLLPQKPEVAIGHLAAFKLAAISVPLFTLFGRDALRFRLKDSGIKLLITDLEGYEVVELIRGELPELKHIVCIDGAVGTAIDFQSMLEVASDELTVAPTSCDDPAMIIYTSGTTGDPKGALLPHRSMLGHMPGVELSHDFLGQDGDFIWSPADWAWIGGLVDVLFAAWQLGVPVLARRFQKFDPVEAVHLIARHGVKNVFMPPTAIKLLRTLPAKDFKGVKLRSMASGGESLGAELLNWSTETLGIEINEFYGQTECNMTVSGCSGLYKIKPGSIGRVAPGHHIGIIDDSGIRLPTGEDGLIAFESPNPVMFTKYWNNEQGTTDKFIGKFLVTGDLGRIDDEGYVTFLGRQDDVITSAGYRIGPGPIEDCLLSHPSVALSAVVGKSDPMRTQIVKAFVVLKEGAKASDALVQELQEWVRSRLAKHEYPREIEFISDLPRTNTGKVIRRLLR